MAGFNTKDHGTFAKARCNAHHAASVCGTKPAGTLTPSRLAVGVGASQRHNSNKRGVEPLRKRIQTVLRERVGQQRAGAVARIVGHKGHDGALLQQHSQWRLVQDAADNCVKQDPCACAHVGQGLGVG